MSHDVTVLAEALDTNSFVGREQDLAWIADKIQTKFPQTCMIEGEPRIGKTTLLFHAYLQMRNSLLPTLGVWIRLNELPRYDSPIFWRFLLYRLQVESGGIAGRDRFALPSVEGKAINDDSYEAFVAFREELQRLIERQDLSCNHVICFIDDFDLAVQGPSKPGLTVNDLNWLRSLVTQPDGSVAIIMSSTRSLSDLELQYGRVSSPLSNISFSRKLGLLTRPEGKALIEQMVRAKTQFSVTENDENFLLEEAGYHPYFLRRCFDYLLEAKANRQDVSDLSVDLYPEVQALFRFDSNVRSLCNLLFERRTLEEQEILMHLASVEQLVVKSNDPTARSLKHLGLTTETSEGIRLFSNAFLYWVKARHSSNLASRVVRARDVVLPTITYDSEEGRLRLNGNQYNLTRTQRRLFEYLYAHEGQVCTYRELLEHVWGGNRSPGVVERTVNRLRDTIDPDSTHQVITTVEGKGYLLRAR